MTETFQVAWELGQLVRVFDDIDPLYVLEIGAWHGGTLEKWLDEDRTVVVIDDEMRKADEWEQWADTRNADLVLLQGFSQDADLVAKAHEFGPYDFCFIDGDHRYEQVKADWQNFSPISRVVALHDIQPRPGYGVAELWSEIKLGRKTLEIWAGEPGYCGIGVVWLD